MRCVTRCSGYLTVYLALVMAVLLSLCLPMIEGVRSNAIRVEAECVMEIGLNSIFAEYHRELFERYNLFAIDASYGTPNSGLEQMEDHLRGYLERNLGVDDIFLNHFLYRDFLGMEAEAVEVKGALLLTDAKGTMFRRRAAEAVKDDCNLMLLQELQQWLQVVEDNGLRDRNVAAEKQALDAQLQEYNGKEMQIAEKEWSVLEVQNPTAYLEEIRRKGILPYVVGEPEKLSVKCLNSGGLFTTRLEGGWVNQGNMPPAELATGEELLERFFFQEYILKYLGCYGDVQEEGALDYQAEYLIANNDTDVANLKQIVTIICAIREAANVMYLYSDVEKCSEAEVLGTVLATMLLVPELASVFKTIILFGWAYAESLYDVEMLLAGGRVPLVKSKESWHYDIDSALNFGKKTDDISESGLSYKDYLRIMMVFVDIDTLTMRAMNMVEANIRLTPGNSYFCMDNCCDRIEARVCIKSRYGYEYEITRRKGYQ